MSRFPPLSPLSPPRNAARPAIVLPPLSLSGRNHVLPGQARNRSSSALVKVSAAIAANKHRKDRNRFSSALSVRYGEEADQVELLSDWSCPKCRGKCTCSCCRKKQALVPTGQLVKTTNASGYKSVDELLHNANNVSVSPMEEATLVERADFCCSYTVAPGTSSQGITGDRLGNDNIFSHQAKLQAVAYAASIYEKSFVYPSPNTIMCKVPMAGLDFNCRYNCTRGNEERRNLAGKMCHEDTNENRSLPRS
ncbi:hypothetical protein OROGR_028840 [Orobanche gracilis]